MADSQSGKQDRRPAELLLNLPSNNPFRNRNSAVSPTASQSPASPFDDPPPRPLSRNPFLDPATANQAAWSSNSNLLSASDNMSADKRPSLTADDIFGSLTLEDSKPKPTPAAPPRPEGAKPSGRPRPPGPPGPPGSGRHGPRHEGMRPPNPGAPPPKSRPVQTQEGAPRTRRAPENGGRPDGRRNSESSVADAGKTMNEEAKKQRGGERGGERSHRHREKHLKHLDVIDKLDASGIIGMFHHDGPFDAVNPGRNRQGSRRRPMDAFPEGSLNNTIGGSGPLNARPNHATFLGQQDDEAFKEWSSGVKDKTGPVFDVGRDHILHGDQSLGLGTSTFLEGTPAARSAIQNQQREEAQRAAEQPKAKIEGLKRGQSLRRIGFPIKRPDRAQPSGDIPAVPHRRSPSGTGPASASIAERKPFFNDYSSGNGEADFTVTNDSNASPASPRGGGGLERRSTTDGTGGEEAQPKVTGGFFKRVKSIKGSRQRPNPSGSEADAVPLPGTAV